MRRRQKYFSQDQAFRLFRRGLSVAAVAERLRISLKTARQIHFYYLAQLDQERRQQWNQICGRDINQQEEFSRSTALARMEFLASQVPIIKHAWIIHPNGKDVYHFRRGQEENSGT